MFVSLLWQHLRRAAPLLLLLLALLLLTRQMVQTEAGEARVLRLESGLQAQQDLLNLLRYPPATERGEHDTAAGASLSAIRLLAEDEPAIRPQHRILTAALGLPQGEPGLDEALITLLPPRAAEAALLSLQDIGLSLRREIGHERMRLRDNWRMSTLAALLCVVLGAGTLAWRLRRARRQDDRHARRAALATAQVSAFYKAAPVGMALLDEQFRIIEANDSFIGLVGQVSPEPAGLLFTEAMPDLAAVLLPLLQQSQRSGEPLQGRDIMIDSRLGGQPLQYAVAAEPVRSPDGPTLLSLVIMDVTARAAAEAWRGEVMAELNHRVKNTLATVQSLAAQTLRGAEQDPSRFAADFSARLGALSRSHEVIAASGWTGITVEQTVHAALSPWLSSGRVAVVGPAGLPLRAAQAQAMVIALAELASNAVRYGALSGGNGRVTLGWDTLPDGRVRLTWQERGGPGIPSQPPRRGFGLRFLERGLPHDLGPGSSAILRFDSQGLYYEICFRPHGAGMNENQATAAA
ncbi:sensor histidine kinase [Pseudoroseomonas ludipueritiae]|uniref:histidine kinase n=1 Tax=Pseudoroseomonas ludipueritiae TaxID=198093 RepID=A0ABR7RAK7_9PROT|nr:PAS domain S-box protein [Pseudoroseomonas ludipueritiae]